MKKDVRHHSFTPSTPLEIALTPDELKVEIHSWANRMDVDPLEIRIMSMSRKWASCSGRGRLTFDVELLRQPEPFRREVILHELLHLKVPNHGPLFRALLSTYMNAG